MDFAMDMDSEPQSLYTVVMPKHENKERIIFGESANLKIDPNYRIGQIYTSYFNFVKHNKPQLTVAFLSGKSILVEQSENAVGHLPKEVAPVVWRWLKSDRKLEAFIWKEKYGFKNRIVYARDLQAHVTGIFITFTCTTHQESRDLLFFILTKKLTTFPGISIMNCPSALKSIAFPVAPFHVTSV
jgi:hypothetical protein